MMLSPEAYYEESLKGLKPDEILREIRRLKREMTRLKKTLEHPDYKPRFYPSEDTRLICDRWYLERAKLALAEAGGEYKPTLAEQRDEKLQSLIPCIEKVEFYIGKFPDAFERITVEAVDDELKTERVKMPPQREWTDEFSLSKEEFFEGISELHLGEWRRNYDPSRYGYSVLDGVSWELKLKISGRSIIRYSGHNAYPHNFSALKKLLLIEFDERNV